MILALRYKTCKFHNSTHLERNLSLRCSSLDKDLTSSNCHICTPLCDILGYFRQQYFQNCKDLISSVRCNSTHPCDILVNLPFPRHHQSCMDLISNDLCSSILLCGNQDYLMKMFNYLASRNKSPSRLHSSIYN